MHTVEETSDEMELEERILPESISKSHAGQEFRNYLNHISAFDKDVKTEIIGSINDTELVERLRNANTSLHESDHDSANQRTGVPDAGNSRQTVYATGTRTHVTPGSSHHHSRSRGLSMLKRKLAHIDSHTVSYFQDCGYS